MNQRGFAPQNGPQMMPQYPQNHRWFHGNIQREEAEGLLVNHDEGTFLIRASTHYPGDFTLSIRHPEPQKVEHYRIISSQRGFTIDDESYFNDLDAIVRHYRADEDGLCTRLGMPVHRATPDQKVTTQRAMLPPNIPPDRLINEQELILGPEVGRGFFGAVFEGEYRGQKVAIKTLQDSSATKAFWEEAHIMLKLRNKHLVDMIGISHRYIVLEFMAKGNLRDYLRTRGRALITNDMQMKFALDVVHGMVYLESKQLVHRDLASRNILISANDDAKVSDFGMAQDDRTPLDGGKIPVKWTAPEAIRHRRFSNKSDVWSFGVLLWEMYSFGKVPYPRIPADEVIAFLEEGSRMPKPDDCPENMYKVMNKCWLWEIDSRPSFKEIEKEILSYSKKH
ncbi:Tyrosine-protein kinase CSK [Holothuria leucospilota]|uniref:Tyrosine-protein kinase n=1 Tax=Holothuria leucospilota TaxID=206669 RepID=A0A9Q1H221_HOLLE|nr:Tyrosine-protein kinase CSK [Holothuria leucospilota]